MVKLQPKPLTSITVPIYTQFMGCTQKLGFPMVHTSILAYEREFSYVRYKQIKDVNITGIEIVSQQQAAGRRRLQQYKIYQLSQPLSGERFANILKALMPIYLSKDYSLLYHNCNHFTRDFLYLVDPKFRLPNEIFRINTFFYYFKQFQQSKKYEEQKDESIIVL